MRKLWLLAVPPAVVVAGVALLGWQRAPAPAPAAGALFDASVVSLRVQFGVTDKDPRAWDGTMSVSGGDVLNLRLWRPRPGDRVIDKASWSLATRKGQNFQRRAWEEEPPEEPVPYLLVPGLIVEVKTTPATRLSFETRNGNFEVTPAQLAPAASLKLLGGAVTVDRVPPSELLSPPDTQNDFASILPGPNGELWVAWIAYANQQDQVMARRFDGRSWGPIIKVSERPGDIFLAKLGRARDGIWAIWSEQVDGNWDLFGRRFDGKSWSRTERLTDDPQPDIYHNLATDANNNLWLVWQGFRSGKSDIWARRYDGSRWSPPERVSLSLANDWEPAIAADSKGRVYVAWDTYDKGSYDVMARGWESGGWSDAMEVAATAKYEAHVSLACDNQDRLWAAWNESGTQWGKDSGWLVKKEATRLYQSRWIGTAVYAGGRWQEPAADFTKALPDDMREYNDFPALASDGRGRVWLFFRHRTAKFRDIHNNTPAHRAAWEIYATSYDGDRWLPPMQLPFTAGRIDMRSGFAADSAGNLFAAWPTDNRDFDEYLFGHADIYAARVPAFASAPAEPKLEPHRQPKIATFPAHANETADLQRIHGYEIRSEGKTYRIYRGDTHRHTEFSMDGNNDGTLAQTYRYAMDAATLDFLGVSDHNGMAGPDIEYINWLEQQMVDLFHLPGTFTPLFAYERSVNYPNGHRNVIFAKRGNPTLPIPKEEAGGRDGAKALYEYLKRYAGIAISHTSASNMGTDWRDNDPQVEPLVEIYQGDRVSAEYEGAPKAAHRANPASAPGGFRPAGYVWNAWAKGYKLGVQASSDHLSTHISYACTLAPDSTREGLLNAMRARHSYGATDNIVLDYRLQTGGREYLQGDIVKAPGEFKLVVKVIGTTPIRQIDVVKNNTFIHNRQPLEREVSFTFADNQPSPGESYYYVRVIQADDNIAWSSPIWVVR